MILEFKNKKISNTVYGKGVKKIYLPDTENPVTVNGKSGKYRIPYKIVRSGLDDKK